MRTVAMVSGGLAGLSVAGLWSVSIIGWVRTTALRRGSAAPIESAGGRTSWTTVLPGVAGVLLVAWGTATLAGGATPIAAGMMAAGLAVAVAGFVARVVAVEAGPSALKIRYAARSSFVVPWGSLHTLSPPRWPLGGWRVAGARGRVLMPSDVFARERLLDVIVARAGLRFRDGAW
ncbi:MAG TPA: hypothetical protein VKA30_12615, partial [Actinomycetota bacterium]|nr:hypothetical protein [Actinomycetota bacterium]